MIPSVGPNGPSAGGVTRSPSQPDFRDTLQNFRDVPQTGKPGETDTLKFSNHAVERMQTRGIRFDADKMEKINQAVAKAAAKGAKNTLLLTDDSALIVSVKDRTIVTVLDRAAMKDNVFTNIDSTVMV